MARAAGYDAFISYSHAMDGKLAPALRTGLEQLARPWRQRRALRIFHDASGLGATPSLWSTISSALDRSRFLIVLASPAAAASEWVRMEIDYFRRIRHPSSIFLVITDGDCRWEPRLGDFDWNVSTAVPATLRGAYAEEPLYLDLRWARASEQLTLRHPGFRQVIADLAAPIHGMARDEIDAADLTEHRRARRARRVATTGLVGLTALATVAGGLAVDNAREARTQEAAAITNARQADRAAQVSEAGRLAALSTGFAAERTDLAVLLSLHSLHTAETREGRLAFATAMSRPAASYGVVPGTEAYGASLEVGPKDLLAAGSSTSGDILLASRTGAAPATVLRGHRDSDSVLELSFDGDESLLASVGLQGELLVHDVASGTVVLRAKGIADATFLPGRRRLVLAGVDGSISVRDVGATKATWTRQGVGRRSSQVSDRLSVTASSDGGTIGVATNDARIVLLRADTGKTVRSWATGGGDANDLAFSDTARFVAAGGDDGTLRIFKTAEGSLLQEHLSNTGGVRRVAWGANQRTVATAGFDARVRIHDLGSGKLVAELTGPTWGGNGLAFSPDRLTLFSSSNGGVRRWGLETGLPSWILGPNDGVVRTTRFSPDARVLATSSGGAVRLWRVDDHDLPFETIDVAAADVAFTPDSRRLVVAGVDGLHGSHYQVIIYDVATQKQLSTIGGLSGKLLTAVDVSSTGEMATVDSDGTVSTFTADGRPLWHRTYPDAGFQLRFSPDGATLAIGGPQSGRVVLADAQTGEQSALWEPGDDGVDPGSLTFSPDGRQLAVGRSDGRVDLVDPTTGRTTRFFLAHQNKVYAVAFSPDGLLLATGGFNGGGISQGGYDGGLRLWDVASGQLVANRTFHDSQVESLAFSADGTWLASGGADHDVLLWPAYARWQQQACAVTGRDLTEAERVTFLKPGERDSHVC